MTKRDLVRDYVKAFPNEQDKTLARKIFDENAGLWTSIEACRSTVGQVLGKRGNKSRRNTANKEMFRPLTHDTTPKKIEPLAAAKILILDIETAPTVAFTFGVWKQNIQPVQIISDWYMISWSAKWLCEDAVFGEILKPKEAKNQDDKRIIKSLWRKLDEADIIVAHNGDKFDIPKINSRFLFHGLTPPSPYHKVDTLKTLHKEFSFTYNNLDYISRLLMEREKIKTDFSLWKGCYYGEKESLDKMFEYNIGDIKLLEDIYLTLRPWIKPHPPVSIHILDGELRCVTCASKELKQVNKDYITTTGVYSTYKCTSCGSLSRRRTSELDVKQKENLLVSVAK